MRLGLPRVTDLLRWAANAKIMYLNLATSSASVNDFSEERMHVGRIRNMTCRDRV
jgi:hypothetical protein